MVMVDVLVGETTTGRILGSLPVEGADFTSTLNGPGEISCTLLLRDRATAARRELRAMTEPQRTFLAFRAGDAIVEAGPIVARDFVDDDRAPLRIKAVGMRGHMDSRLLLNGNAVEPQKTVLLYTGLSWGTIMKRAVERTLDNAGGGLPIVLPADEPGAQERRYTGHQFYTVGQVLDEINSVNGGPDVAFEPRLTPAQTHIEWLMRVGTTAQPLLSQTGQDWQWDSTARGGIGGLSVSEDATGRVNAVYATGQGYDQAILVARAWDATEWDRGYPRLDGVFSHSTEDDPSVLGSLAAADLQQGSRPWTTWKLDVARDTFPNLGTYRPGDWVSVHVAADHPWLPGGVYRSRITAFRGSLTSPMVSIDLRPTLESR